MVLDEPDGLPAGKLNRVQLRMMLGASIPNHLRLYLKEIDLKVRLEYAVSGKRMLSHLLKSEKLQMKTFFGLLLQVAQGMEEGRLYMLEPERYALHEDYIFIEGTLQNGKVHLTYVPLDGPAPEVKPGESLRSLIMVLMTSVTELRGDGVQRLLHYCGEEGFTSAGLKKLLAELLTEGNGFLKRPSENKPGLPELVEPVKEQAAAVRIVQEKDRQRPGSGFVQAELPPSEDKRKISAWMSGFPGIQSRENAGEISSSGREPADGRTPTSSSRTYVALGCLLGDALLWKFLYFNHPKLLWLIVCGLATVVLAAVCVMSWRGLMGPGSSEEDEDEDENEDTQKGGGIPGIKLDVLERSLGRRPPLNTARPLAMPEVDFNQREFQHGSRPLIVARGEAEAKDNKELTGATASTASTASTPTALLTREKAPGNGQETGKRQTEAPYLVRSEEAGEALAERIELNRPSFIIGRSAEVAQYIERSDGASRVHAEISRSNVGYVLKDLDSRNGTLFQGEAMIPYKEYRLADGDVFTIVKGSYTFRTA
ncbi:DUF6382 domain-containing protein [Paenibacillus sp. BR2-3]|uniref:DUF6382 domain-containing protein n=1 Tax=Paenibacillus sp. BR2-3 TaxID=3048494 RepID=UPI0039775534